MILIHLFPNHSFLGVNEELEVFKDFSRLSLSILNVSTDPNIHLQFQYVGGTKYVTTQTTTITIIPAFRHSSYPPRSFHILPNARYQWIFLLSILIPCAHSVISCKAKHSSKLALVKPPLLVT